MKNVAKYVCMVFIVATLFGSCSPKSENLTPSTSTTYVAIASTFGTTIDFSNLENYASQSIPSYITKNNINGNPITDAKATLGRVLFYDKNLSVRNTISCGSCHKQELAFGDSPQASTGVNGTTTRHSMRLVNTRFAAETKFFWNERALTLEAQTTQPMQDHAEMGFSGLNGDPSLGDLLTKLAAIDYYKELFTAVYGDRNVTEARLQECLAQFIRSIQSFDSKYDAGRSQVANDQANFPNFSALENQGKNLFVTPPQFNASGIRIAGGAGCAGCHRSPEFDIDPNSLNNGTIGAIGGGTDLTVTRSPTLRDLLKPNGTSNGTFMHTGATDDFNAILTHYNLISLSGNTNLDPRLRPGGNPQNLQLTQAERDALIAFVKTLGGTNIYTDKKWANPFR